MAVTAEPGEDVDGRQLVHLARALELVDVEAVEADELARTTTGQAEPEGLVLALGVGHDQPDRCRRNRRRLGQALGPLTQPVRHQVLLHRRLGDREALVTEPVSVLATADGGLEDGQGQQGLDDVGGGGFGQLRVAPPFGHECLEAVAIGDVLPLVVAGPRDAEDGTGSVTFPVCWAWSNTAMRRW